MTRPKDALYSAYCEARSRAERARAFYERTWRTDSYAAASVTWADKTIESPWHAWQRAEEEAERLAAEIRAAQDDD